MFPSALDDAFGKGWDIEDPTPGEARFYLFCRDVLKPDQKFTVWFQPLLQLRQGTAKPDFAIHDPNLGLIVAEVKDWRIAEIEEFTTERVVFRDGREPRSNPIRQAEGHVAALLDCLKEAGLVGCDGVHAGTPKIPICALVVFPYITHAQFEEAKLNRVLPADRVVFGDEMVAAAANDRHGEDLLRCKVEARIRFRPPALTKAENARLAQALWLGQRIHLPDRKGTGKWHFHTEIDHLDRLQARLARRFARGHCLLKGGAGTGKTVILVERCRYLTSNDPKVCRSVIVCFNIALATYLRRLVQEAQIDPAEGSVDVAHFFDLCAKVTGEAVEYEGKSSEYYQFYRDLMLEMVRGGTSKVQPYDAVYIDEAQDFDEQMISAVVGLLRKGGDLLLAFDPGQTLYRRRFSWKSVGVDVAGDQPVHSPASRKAPGSARSRHSCSSRVSSRSLAVVRKFPRF